MSSRHGQGLRLERPSVLLYIVLLVTPSETYFGLTHSEPIPLLKKDPLEVPRVLVPRTRPVPPELCERLKLSKTQRRLCRRDPGMGAVLHEAMGLSHAQSRFGRAHSWSLTHHPPTNSCLSPTGFRETAFLFAMSAAGLTHSVAHACSTGRLERCTCDEAPELQNRVAWRWGGCGDNTEYGVRFARRFLRGQSAPGKDLRARMDRHNTRVGLQVCRVTTMCKCHGVSGSCTVRTCWRQLQPFQETGRTLKHMYEMARKVVASTNQAAGGEQSTGHGRGGRRYCELLYLDDSPSFCGASEFSAGTAGRMCQPPRSCERLCCGRGHNTQRLVLERPCQCQVRWCCYVQCSRCMLHEDVYTCKV
uniref:Protein Wnt n=1 Tax=Eptatretus burgeri TaxID=7764 RepID=A0A8C4QXZ7_EPTBU